MAPSTAAPGRVRVLRMLRLLAVALVALAFWLPVLVFAYETATLFWPRATPVPPEAARNLPFPVETVRFPTEDGLNLEAWFVPGQPGRGAIILCHGSGGNRTEMEPYATFLAAAGYPLLMLDFRAHGNSDGQRMSLGYEETRDVAAAVRYLHTRPDVDGDRLGALGISLGAAVVTAAAAELPEIKAVVLDSTYGRYTDLMRRFFTPDKLLRLPLDRPALWLASFLFGREIRNFAPVVSVKTISPRAVFIIHGARDIYNTTVDDARAVFAAAGAPKDLWIVPDTEHVQAVHTAPQEYRQRVVGFFDRYLMSRP